jgi:nucleotide-binding universal stress UspA family protein
VYRRLLVPLDGSRTAGAVLPYVRTLARTLELPVELLGVVDIGALATQVSHAGTRYLETIIAGSLRSSVEYLKGIAKTFPGREVKYTVEKGKAEEMIIEKADSDATLTAMATHGRSGFNRLLLGSVAEKVLRGSTNPLLLIRPSEAAHLLHRVNERGEAILRSIIVPLDGSELAESVLPAAVELAKTLELEILLLRAYPRFNTYAGADDYNAVNYEVIRGALRDEAQSYLESKVGELKLKGVEKVSFAIPEGSGAGEIVALGRRTPDNLIAMCTHGRSGLKRWVLGSVTEKVVRLSRDPVLIVRGGRLTSKPRGSEQLNCGGRAAEELGTG